MIYGVTFGDKHTYKDWGLIMQSRPVITPPEAKTIYVDIPASDGSLDLTESMTGDVKFKDRKISFVFTVIDSRNRWTDIYSKIQDYLHGQRMKIFLDEDPEYYYIGRVTVNDWSSSLATATIKIDAEVEPYKLERYGSLDEWLWDPFNFETGEIRYYKDIVVSSSKSMVIHGSRKAIVPVFNVTLDAGEGNISLSFKQGSEDAVATTYTLANGINRFLDLIIRQGDNFLSFTGNGTVSIDYHGGRL